MAVCDDKGEHFGFSVNSSLHFSNDLVQLLYYGPDTANGEQLSTVKSLSFFQIVGDYVYLCCFFNYKIINYFVHIAVPVCCLHTNFIE